MKSTNIKSEKRYRLKRKIRAKVSGTAKRPRLSVYRSNKFIYGQIIDDAKSVTIVSVTDMKEKVKGGRVDKSKAMGLEIAKRALAAGITDVIFDRNGFRYTGRVQSFADGAREGGLKF